MQFEKFNSPKPYPERTDSYDIQYEKTEAELPAMRTYNSYVGSNPCPGWHAPVNRRPDDIEAEVKKWLTKGVVALVICWGLILASILAWKVLIDVWMMR